MTDILGVSGSHKNLNLLEGQTSFWCVFRNFDVKPGNLLALYYTRHGVAQFYKIEELVPLGDVDERIQCSMRNMLTIKTILVLNLDHPISVKMLKSDDVMKTMDAVRRNFQTTSYQLLPKHLNRLKKLVLDNNPDYDTTALDQTHSAEH